MAPRKSGVEASPAGGSSTPRFKREFLNGLMARFDDQSAAVLAKQSGLEAYQFSRILNGKGPFKASDLVQIAGAFDCDIREAFADPTEDARAIIHDVQKILAPYLKGFYKAQYAVDMVDPDEWERDEQWVRTQRCLESIEANDKKAERIKEQFDETKKECQLALAEFRNGLEGNLGPLGLVKGRDHYIIEKRNIIEKCLNILERMIKEQTMMSFVPDYWQIDDRDLAMMHHVYEQGVDYYEDGAAQMQRADEQEASDDVKPSPPVPAPPQDSVTPAPPPPAHAAQTSIKDLPQYGQARAGRDGFSLPAGAEAMSHIARPFFLDGVGTAYAVYVNGDSMEPRFRHGELLFVDPSRPPKRGDDCVVQVAFGDDICGFVKRFVSASDETTTVEQFNPAKDIKYQTADVRAVHLVVGSLVAGVS